MPTAARQSSSSTTASASASSPDSISPVLSGSSGYFASPTTTPHSAGTSPTSAGNPHPSPTFFSRIRRRSRSPSGRRPADPHSPSSPTSAPDFASAPTSSASHHPPRLHNRSKSNTLPATPSAATSAMAAAMAGGPRARSRSRKRHSGTMMQVGRHGNEWLFGNFSFTEKIRGVLGPHGDGEERQ